MDGVEAREVLLVARVLDEHGQAAELLRADVQARSLHPVRETLAGRRVPVGDRLPDARDHLRRVLDVLLQHLPREGGVVEDAEIVQALDDGPVVRKRLRARWKLACHRAPLLESRLAVLAVPSGAAAGAPLETPCGERR